VADILFTPLHFRNLTIKNRVIRSSVTSPIDHYDGSGSQPRINWEVKFARGGVGAIISALAAVSVRGRVVPRFATINRDDRIPFWQELGRSVHQHDCRFIIQLGHSGRQRDIHGVDNARNYPLTSSSGREPFHGIYGQEMSLPEIKSTTEDFAAAARRASEAGLDGIEIHAAHGYLFTQFLSSAINRRTDQYGGTLENRARFLLEVVRAVREEVGDQFHLQVKLNAFDAHNALYPWHGTGTTLPESIEVCRWLEQAGVDALHISAGSMFPHPMNPPGGFPMDIIRENYGSVIAAGSATLRNYFIIRHRALWPLFRLAWNRTTHRQTIEGAFLNEAREIKKHVDIPVISVGGHQRASAIRDAITSESCDSVGITRALIANPDLIQWFEQGYDQPPRPCSYCNRCLYNVAGNPMGCYDVSRYGGDYDKMMDEIFSLFRPNEFETPAVVPTELNATPQTDQAFLQNGGQ
jgi:2,4-dienoyl-CoA reductase-like NADH-dependent reductase (Old Yellow Enzyme family)